MAAAAPAPAPTRVQPGRTVKTPEYKQRKLALAERTHRTLAKPRQSVRALSVRATPRFRLQNDKFHFISLFFFLSFFKNTRQK